MADVTVSVTGLQAIVNPTEWNASRMGWGQGMYNTGGYVDENILQGWGHVAWAKLIGVILITTITFGGVIHGALKFGVVHITLQLFQLVLQQQQV